MDRLDENDSYNITINEEELKDAHKGYTEVTVNDTFIKLIDSIADFLVNEHTNCPEKHIVFFKLMKHQNFYYSFICDEISEIDDYIENSIKNKQKDAFEFLWLTIDVSILSKEESIKTLKNLFYHALQTGVSINDIAMCDLTTNIRTRGYTLSPWKEYIQG